MQESFVFCLSMFKKECVLKAADHFFCLDSLRRLRSLFALSDAAAGKLKQCSSINRLYLLVLAATAPEEYTGNMLPCIPHRHLALLQTASKFVIFLFCSCQILILPGQGHKA